MDPMQEAIKSAKVGVDANHGGPFGACIVRDDKVLAVAHNTVIRDKDPTCHAEMNAIRIAAKEIDSHILEGCTLYTTSEPCPMCLTAILWARIDKIYFGLSREHAASLGFDDDEFYQAVNGKFNKANFSSEMNKHNKKIKEVFINWRSLNRELY